MDNSRTKNATKKKTQNADEFALSILPARVRWLAQGLESLDEIASFLNSQGIQTYRGGKWGREQVRRVDNRLDKIREEQPEVYNEAAEKALKDQGLDHLL